MCLNMSSCTARKKQFSATGVVTSEMCECVQPCATGLRSQKRCCLLPLARLLHPASQVDVSNYWSVAVCGVTVQSPLECAAGASTRQGCSPPAGGCVVLNTVCGATLYDRMPLIVDVLQGQILGRLARQLRAYVPFLTAGPIRCVAGPSNALRVEVVMY